MQRALLTSFQPASTQQEPRNSPTSIAQKLSGDLETQ